MKQAAQLLSFCYQHAPSQRTATFSSHRLEQPRFGGSSAMSDVCLCLCQGQAARSFANPAAFSSPLLPSCAIYAASSQRGAVPGLGSCELYLCCCCHFSQPPAPWLQHRHSFQPVESYAGAKKLEVVFTLLSLLPTPLQISDFQHRCSWKLQSPSSVSHLLEAAPMLQVGSRGTQKQWQ